MMPPSALSRIVAVLAAGLAAGACATSGGVPRPFPVPGAAPTQPVTARPGAASEPVVNPEVNPLVNDDALVGTALALRGIPYREGGSGPEGFDCSGFTQYVYAQHGVALPREVRDQFVQGAAIRPEDVAPGDLLFFTTIAPGPTHVAIAIGGDRFVHAPSSTGVIRVESLHTKYWASRYLGARRPATLP